MGCWDDKVESDARGRVMVRARRDLLGELRDTIVSLASMRHVSNAPLRAWLDKRRR